MNSIPSSAIFHSANGKGPLPGLRRERLRALLRAFRGRHVLVIGDCMLDEYLWGRVTRISPEAPVPVVEHERTTCAAGGASNVAVNLVALEGRATLVAVVGDDAAGESLRRELERQGVRHDGLVVDSGRPTTVKTRIIAQSHQLGRVDREVRTPVSPLVAERLVAGIRRDLADADAVLFSDYLKGVLTEEVVAEAHALARRAGKPVFANPKPTNIHYYRGLNLVSLNQLEAEAVTGLSLADLGALEEVGAQLMRGFGVEAAIITLGGRGLALLEPGAAPRYLPVVALEVFDPCGCGDSAIAAAALARTAGADWVEAATLANLAGNAKVRKLGVVPVTCSEIEHVWVMGNAQSSEDPATASLADPA